MKAMLLLLGLLATTAVAQVPIIHMAATTVEVTGIDHKDLPAAIFELPADYRMQEGV